MSRHGNQRIKWKGFKRLETGEESSGVGSGLCCGVLKGGAAPLEHRGGSCTDEVMNDVQIPSKNPTESDS